MKQELWSSHPNHTGNTHLEAKDLSLFAALSSPKEVVTFVSRGAWSHQPEIPVFCKNGSQQQGEPWLPHHLKSAGENRSGCRSPPQSKPKGQPLSCRAGAPAGTVAADAGLAGLSDLTTPRVPGFGGSQTP